MFKKKLLIVLLVCFKYNTYSQDISIKDLTLLRCKTLTDVELYMKQHRWEVFQSEKPLIETNGKEGSIVIKQGFTTFLQLKNNKATASSLTFIYTGKSIKENIILLGFLNKEKFLKYKKSVAKNNRMITSYIEENGDFIEIYEREELIYEFKISILSEDLKERRENYYLTIYDYDYFKGVSKYFDLEKIHFL